MRCVTPLFSIPPISSPWPPRGDISVHRITSSRVVPRVNRMAIFRCLVKGECGFFQFSPLFFRFFCFLFDLGHPSFIVYVSPPLPLTFRSLPFEKVVLFKLPFFCPRRPDSYFPELFFFLDGLLRVSFFDLLPRVVSHLGFCLLGITGQLVPLGLSGFADIYCPPLLL